VAQNNGLLSGTSARRALGRAGGPIRRRLRDSRTLSGTSPAAWRRRHGRAADEHDADRDPGRRRHPRQAADAFLSSPRVASPNTRRAYAGVLDRLAAELGPGRQLAAVPGDEIAAALAGPYPLQDALAGLYG